MNLYPTLITLIMATQESNSFYATTHVIQQKHNILHTLPAFPRSVDHTQNREVCWGENRLCSHQIHDRKQPVFYSYNFSTKGAWVAAPAVCWLRLRVSQNDRCSPEVIIWMAASEQAGGLMRLN